MKALLSKIDKIERVVRNMTKVYRFEVVTNEAQYADLATEFENDDETVCVIYKLYED